MNDKETKAGFKWSTVHDGFSLHVSNNAIPSNFGLDLRRFDAQQDKIRCCNWTFVTVCWMPTERYSIRKWFGINKKSAWNWSRSAYLPIYRYGTLSITAPATSKVSSEKLNQWCAMRNSSLEININKFTIHMKHVMCTTIQCKRFAKAL